MFKTRHKMPEKKNFLLLAIGMGCVGIIIGAITIWNSTSELFTP
jgi:hypothetical protein